MKRGTYLSYHRKKDTGHKAQRAFLMEGYNLTGTRCNLSRTKAGPRGCMRASCANMTEIKNMERDAYEPMWSAMVCSI